MIEFQDLLDYCRAEALASKVSPTEDSVWRSICRDYSEMFHTPLHLVLQMDAEHVVLNVYEKQAEGLDIEDYQKLEYIMDVLRTIEDPNYEAVKSKEQEEFDRRAEEEEELRIKSGKAVHPTLQKQVDAKRLLEKGEPETPAKPTGGMVNLDYLAKQDSEG